MKRITKLKDPPRFLSYASVGGASEALGPLGDKFDFTDPGDKFGMKTWELAEGEMGRVAFNIALTKARMSHEAVDVLISGDLQNQCVASSLGLSAFGIPHIGVYGACSTATEALLIASTMLGVGAARVAACVTTSHNLAAERQFRAPTEYGSQRAPTAQWTATAGGAFILTSDNELISKSIGEYGTGRAEIADFRIGRMVDGATRDASNMGAAMAFAAIDSILSYFEESELSPSAFDLIVTGDLGAVGSAILRDVLSEKLPSAASRHTDCGLLLYDMKRSDVHSGASGCGTSASVLAAHFLPMIERGDIGDILFLSTGALMSQSSVLQGSTISGIAPAIHIRRSHGA